MCRDLRGWDVGSSSFVGSWFATCMLCWVPRGFRVLACKLFGGLMCGLSLWCYFGFKVGGFR